MIDQLLETFARHEDLAPAPEQVRRRIDAVATRRRRLRKGLVGATAVAVVALFAGIYVQVDPVSTMPRIGASAVAREPVTFLIAGVDRRPWESEPTGLLRSDTIMLAHLPADRSAPYLISIPRDVLVPYGTGQEILGGVYAHDGIRGLRDAVRSLTGIPIDGAVEVDFAGVIKVTDAVGGVDLCVPRRAVSEHTRRIFQPGCRRFTGEEAMDYLRQRKSFENGDFSRQQHIREYVRALYQRIGDAGPAELMRLIRAGGDAVRIDSGTFELPALLAAVRDAKAAPVTIETPAEHADDGLHVRFTPGATTLWTAVREGKLPDWVAANPGNVDQR